VGEAGLVRHVAKFILPLSTIATKSKRND